MDKGQVQLVDQAISSRHSVRAFLDRPVDPQMIKDILSVASRAPSGTNIQPWKVYVVTGEKRQELIDRVCQAQTELYLHPERAADYQATFSYYPEQWFSPFIERYILANNLFALDTNDRIVYFSLSSIIGALLIFVGLIYMVLKGNADRP